MPIRPRLTLVTLGVADMARAVAFYDRLGWRRSGAHDPGEVAFYRLDTVILSLFPRTHLAADAQVLDTPPGFGGVTLALNQDSEAAVDAVLAEAVAAGAKLLKPARRCSGVATRAISPTRTATCGRWPTIPSSPSTRRGGSCCRIELAPNPVILGRAKRDWRTSSALARFRCRRLSGDAWVPNLADAPGVLGSPRSGRG